MAFHSTLPSFGLEASDKEAIVLEPWFLLGYYFGLTLPEYLTLPVSYKRWLIERIGKEIKKASESKSDIPSKGIHDNSPDLRSMSGKFRTFGAHGNHQRFT